MTHHERTVTHAHLVNLITLRVVTQSLAFNKDFWSGEESLWGARDTVVEVGGVGGIG